MAATRRLIVNADDFGLTQGVNRAIAEGHRNGIVTSTTLMANGAAFVDAVNIARENPTLGVGCHIVLLDGTPLLPAKAIPTLTTDENNFERNLNRFAWRAARGNIRPHDVRAEAEAQIRKLQSAGIHVMHVDTHKHAHIFADILQPVLDAASACGVRAIRNPFEPRRAL